MSNDKPRKSQEGFFTAVSFGFFLLLVGAIFVITPNLFGEIIDFFEDFSIVSVPNTNISFLGLENPLSHMAVYEAAAKFSIALVVFQVIMLVLRFAFPSSWGKRSETFGNLVYWAGSAYLIQIFLIESVQWFVFWSAIIMVIGVSLIARAAFMAVSRF